MGNRIWIYQADRFLSDEEVSEIESSGQEFINNWQAHGADLDAELILKHHVFLIIKLDEGKQEATGCSIDSSVDWIRKISKDLNVNFFDRMNVVYLKGESFQMDHIARFNDLFLSEKIDEKTPCFNNLVSTWEELEKSWLVPLKDHWAFTHIDAITKV